MMNIVQQMLQNVEIPEFYKVKYNFEDRKTENIEESVRLALKREKTLSRINKDSVVAVTISSREIKNLAVIIRVVVDEVKSRGAKPFLFPAMGSHGGATAEGQLDIARSYGITEEAVGAPIYSSMRTSEIGKTPEGLSVHIDSIAVKADHIIPINRVKPHPEFRGKFESGLIKMLAIGVGKQHGAESCHQMGMDKMADNIVDFGKVILENCSVPFGVAILENGKHETYDIVCVPGEKILVEEPELLKTAKKLLPVIPFEKIDVIICEEMGKEISGTGLDSNVIGRSISLGISKPYAERIGIFDLTNLSHGNFNGVGLGDVISKRLFDKMSFSDTYPNTITGSEPNAVKIPPVMETDRACFNFCLKTCTKADPNNFRIVWIKNTLSIDSFYISEGLMGEATRCACLEINMKKESPEFDSAGKFIGFKV